MNAAELRERIGQADRRPMPFEVPQWGVTVWLRPLSLADRLALAEEPDDCPAARRCGLLVVRAVVDSFCERVWQDDEADGLADRDGEAVGSIAAKVRELSKLGVSADEAAAEKKGS